MPKNTSEHHQLKKGLSIFGRHIDDPIQMDPLFHPAKTGDYSAAVQLIEKFWNEDKTDELRRLILPERPPIFFSVPSTSRTNQIPIAYARFLAQKTQDMGATYVVGDEHISSLHTSMMKVIKKSNRFMSPRLYETFQKTFFDNLRNHAQNAQVMLVEDIITTGSSVNAFRHFLEQNDVPVECIIGLKGETQLDPAESDLKKLERTANKAGLDELGVDWIALGRELTQSEVTTLSAHYIGHQYKNADEEAKKLMRQQLSFLYALRVCHQFEVSKNINEITQILQTMEKSRA